MEMEKEYTEMENLEEYTGLELIQLLEMLERDRFPSAELYQLKEKAVTIAATKLDLPMKEICWIAERPKNEKWEKDEERNNQKEKKLEMEEKNWGQQRREMRATREVIKTIAGTVSDIDEKIAKIEGKVDKLEKSWQSLSFQNIIKKE